MNESEHRDLRERLLAMSGEELLAFLDANQDDPAIWDAFHDILRDDRDRTELSWPGRLGDVAPRPEGTPARIGEFRIEGVLASGGMGTVYLALQEVVPRLVALKVIRADLVDVQHIERFRREFEAIGSLSHPNVAAVHQAGEMDDGTPWFAMEFVDGPWLTDFARQHELSIDARLRLFVDLCRGVQYAHQNGVFHRDLKPSNVLVSGSPDEPTPKLIDFGLAAFEDERRRTASLSSDRRSLVGSLAYMSPEQAGLGPRVDARCDVYSLGVILYELLTGVRPLPDETHGDPGWEILPELIRTRDPMPPSRRLRHLATTGSGETGSGSERGAARRLVGDLDRIVMHALEKRPDDRYQSVKELADDIARHLSGEPVMARERTASYLFGKFIRRHRAVSALLAALIVVSLGGVIGVSVYATEARRALDRFRNFGITARIGALVDGHLADPGAARPEGAARIRDWLDDVEAVRAGRDRLDVALAELASLPPPAENEWETEIGARRQLAIAIEVALRRMAELEELARLARVRLEWADSVHARTVDAEAAAWQRVAEQLAADDRFGPGFRFPPQVGLVPLQRGPAGFQEFAMPLPGATVPVRSADGAALAMKATDCPVFVLLPPTRFRSGSQGSDENGYRFDPYVRNNEINLDREPVELGALLISKYEITCFQWRCMTGQDVVDHWQTEYPGVAITADCPASFVSATTLEYGCRSWGLAVPSGREWEYAARGGSDTPWWSGADWESLQGAENIGDLDLMENDTPDDPATVPWRDGYVHWAPVGAFEPNPFGLHDVLGNVREVTVRRRDDAGNVVYETRAGSWHQGWPGARVTNTVLWLGVPHQTAGLRPSFPIRR